jgi:sodium/bile acid cotransporter 7
LHFFGKSIELPFLDLVKKLCSKVLLPVAAGQALRATPMKKFYSSHTGFFKRFQEVVILGIVWNAFCNAFTSGLGLEVKHAAALLLLLPALHAVSLVSLSSFFNSKVLGFSSGEAKAATFCGAHKTLAFGLPLINTIFEGNLNLGELQIA